MGWDVFFCYIEMNTYHLATKESFAPINRIILCSVEQDFAMTLLVSVAQHDLCLCVMTQCLRTKSTGIKDSKTNVLACVLKQAWVLFPKPLLLTKLAPLVVAM